MNTNTAVFHFIHEIVQNSGMGPCHSLLASSPLLVERRALLLVLVLVLMLVLLLVLLLVLVLVLMLVLLLTLVGASGISG